MLHLEHVLSTAPLCILLLLMQAVLSGKAAQSQHGKADERHEVHTM